MAAAAAVGTKEAAGAAFHTAALAPVLAAAVGDGYGGATLPALVSGKQGRCKAQCSRLGPSSKPHLRGTWIWICSKGNNHHN